MIDQRVNLNDDMLTVFQKLSEGNPGALTVLMTCFQRGSSIDPDNALGGFGVVLSFDSYGIYGSDIWKLYKDVCGQDVTKMMTYLRAVQLGELDLSDLKRTIASGDPLPLTFDQCLTAVRNYCPDFATGV